MISEVANIDIFRVGSGAKITSKSVTNTGCLSSLTFPSNTQFGGSRRTIRREVTDEDVNDWLAKWLLTRH